MKKKGKICVFGGSNDGAKKAYTTAAYRLGQLMAEHGWDSINGAGTGGMMRGVSDGVLDGGGDAIGVIPQFMVDNGWNYERLSETIVTADMHERKEKMCALADAFIVLPGGCGTLEELMEMYTWRQLGIIKKPLVLLNVEDFYRPLIDMIERCGEQGFMRQGQTNLWTIASTPEEALNLIEKELTENQ